jgi:hypothetical protein
MKMDAKIPNKILANWIPQHIKIKLVSSRDARIVQHIQIN